MKKFGTPIGAAPGSANENAGFDELGALLLLVPLPKDCFGLELCFGWELCFGLELCLGLTGVVFRLPLPDPLLFELPGCVREDGGWAVPGCVACGAVCVEVVEVDVVVVVVLGRDVEVEVEVEVEVGVGLNNVVVVVVGLVVVVVVGLDVVVVVVVVGLNVVVVVVVGLNVVVVVVGVHDSDSTLAPAGTPGIAETGVPGRMFTGGREIVLLVRSWTVSVHTSAEATGSSAIAWMASTVPTVTSATVRFRLLNTLAYLLPIRVRM